MRITDIILMIGPLFILAALMPVFEVATVSEVMKGGVIGVYVSISIIAFIQMRGRRKS